MDTAVIVALITVLGGAATTGVGKWLLDRRKSRDPITRGQAEVALAQASLGMAATSRDMLVEDVERLKADRAEDRKRIDSLEEGRREDRSIIRASLAVLTGPVVTILDWLDSGAQPPPPHDTATDVRRQIADVQSRLTEH